MPWLSHIDDPSARLLNIDHFLHHHLVLLAAIGSSPDDLLIRIRYMTPNADVLPELASRESRLEHLVDFLKSAILDLREVEVDPYRSEEARRSPNPAYRNVNC
jgi:hypothetical protein